MSNTPKKSGSTHIRLWLEIDGDVYPLDQVADEWIMMSDSLNHPPTNAAIVMEIDGRKHRRFVNLPNGISMTDEFVPIREVVAGKHALAG